MRLGGFFSVEKLDMYGLSRIPAPNRLAEISLDECYAFSQRTRKLGIMVGKSGMWQRNETMP